MVEHWLSWRGATSYVYINILKLSHRKHNFKVILSMKSALILRLELLLPPFK